MEEFRKRLDSIGDYSFPSSKKENKNNSTNDGFIDFLLKNGPSADVSEFNNDSDDESEFDLEEEFYLDEEFFTDE